MQTRKEKLTMNPMTEEAGRLHTQLIRYITANFSSLRGLRRLPFGIYYLLCIVLDGWVIPYAFQTSFFFTLFGALFLVALGLIIVVDWSYTRAFGSVLSSTPAKKIVPFSRVWLWVPVVVGVLLLTGLIRPAAPSLAQWSIFIGYPVVMIGSFVMQKRRSNAYGGVPVWPMIIGIVVFVLVPGFIRLDSQHPGLNNFALQDWIIAVFLVGSGIYNHLQLMQTFRRISEGIRDISSI